MVYRKGQLSIDFYISLVIFLGFLAYITFQLFQVVPTTASALKEESVRIEAYQISEILVNDGGHPNDWETRRSPEIKRIGLSDVTNNKTNLLSSQKISRLQTICQDDFDDVKDKLDITDEISIKFINHETEEQWTCESSTISSKKTSFNIGRTVSIDGTSFGEIIVEVWEK